MEADILDVKVTRNEGFTVTEDFHFIVPKNGFYKFILFLKGNQGEYRFCLKRQWNNYELEIPSLVSTRQEHSRIQIVEFLREGDTVYIETVTKDVNTSFELIGGICSKYYTDRIFVDYQKSDHVHEWKEYVGFTERYKYCTKCDSKINC